MTRVGGQGGVPEARVWKKAEPYSPGFVQPKDLCVGTPGAGQPESVALTWEDRPTARVVPV